jgi:hypothetical protein
MSPALLSSETLRLPSIENIAAGRLRRPGFDQYPMEKNPLAGVGLSPR